MASKDKTSKTARVMNLLSKKTDSAADEAAAQQTPAPSAPVPPIVTSMAPDVAVSAQIKNALENALEGELSSQPAAPQPAPVVPEPQPAPAPVKTVPLAAEPAPAPVKTVPLAAEPEPAPVKTVPLAAEPAPPTQWKEPLHPQNPGYVNVMQVLVEEKAPKYVQLFGLCSCERCMEDVKAYTLNHLTPKYVVLEPGDRIPRITVYEGRFSSDITAQLLQACKVVMERPHHGR